MMDDLDDVNGFVERIAKPLRAPERAAPSFRGRVMAAVHAMTRTESTPDAMRVSPAGGTRIPERRMPPWWSRPYWIRVTPLSAFGIGAAALAVAAAFVLLRPAAVRRAATPAAPVAVAHDTVHVVRFVLVDSGARSVSLVGEFNQWQKDATAMHAGSRPGVWTAEVPLEDGRHEYAFVVRDANGERWVADPVAETRFDEFGTESSVILIGNQGS